VRRISLLVRLTPEVEQARAFVQVSNVESEVDLPVAAGAFLLTLEHESGSTYTRGQFKSVRDNVSYPIQGSAALFDALSAYVARGERN
jgi:hypothetical protein